MQIRCDYCGNIFQDTLATCPYCGATNNRVTRTAKDQPLTIEELQEWYQSKKLPPYETTRFFIGRNVHEPRAFGIYRDGHNVVVYKNKADGTRAVRYEGEDEAYAVNEIFQRLKQEILQQKSHNMNRSSTPDGSYSSRNNGSRGNRKGMGVMLVLLLIFVMFVFPIFGIGFIMISASLFSVDSYEYGYYKSENNYYYHDDDTKRWFEATIDERFDTFEEKCVWSVLSSQPKEIRYNKLNKKSKFKNIYVSRKYESSLENAGIEDFKKSLDYKDYLNENRIGSGYYTCNDVTYYHISSKKDIDWYYYDNDSDIWNAIPYFSLPVELRHYETSEDFYVTLTWSESTQASDFKTTDFYDNWKKELTQSTVSSGYDNDDNNDNDYDWGDNDSWNSNNTDWDSDW